MTAALTPEVTDRLNRDHYGWLTTVAKSGQPVPRLIWFYFDGEALFVYSNPAAAKVAHVRRHPQVSLNLDSDGNGGGIVVVGGEAIVDAEGADCRDDGPYWAKYGAIADQFGLTESMADYSTRLRIRVDKVWTTPTA
ncbi:TIGR03667 family PPOX class F420-dependent oxidoreductase [Mycobacterium hodleri]|uniref:TIGR03667 family PPOX class F420-dependent oxidoreductase n=1 Tax=Mycolicibacterium hodleri TaxID=49897 RepID=UPI0021F38214|nr:TIGR03667 family PPOX class F420-dependent oxidoreductase [Mycolicibacterium hodleri]MCV7135640.1 TIGR03667 family PPOX class F420-dependent oxidoreductase [Mycolicibacterium hodleri]